MFDESYKPNRRKQSPEGAGLFRALTVGRQRSLLFVPRGAESLEYRGKLFEILLHPDTSEQEVSQLTDALNRVVEAVRIGNSIKRSSRRDRA